MSTRTFLTNVGGIALLMALLATAELAIPLFVRPSGRQPIRRANLRLTGLTFAANWAILTATGMLAVASTSASSGMLPGLAVTFPLRFVVGLVVLDFAYGYLAHWALHRSSILWRVHRVHHSDPFVDVTTAFRNHPLESLWRQLFVLVAVAALGIPAEAVVAHRALSAVNAVFEHANIRVWGALDRSLTWIWVTPHLHKLHHSRDRRETDSNYGNLFSIFDRAFGTFTPSTRITAVVYGLDDTDETAATTLRALVRAPFTTRRTGMVTARTPLLPATPRLDRIAPR